MSFDLHKILESKSSFRRNLATRPIGEKLRMLDAMRQRELSIRGWTPHKDGSILSEERTTYGKKKE